MAIYQFERSQLFQVSLEEMWDFISSPGNLKLITPPQMGFDIITKNIPEKMYAGMIIGYKVKILGNFSTTWVSEITQVQEKSFFIDEQRMGPYRMWHHQHILERVDDQTLMRDIITYQPPFGILGVIANRFFIRKKLEQIFEYRKIRLEEIFGSRMNHIKDNFNPVLLSNS